MTHLVQELDMYHSRNQLVYFFRVAIFLNLSHLKSQLSTFMYFRASHLAWLFGLVTQAFLLLEYVLWSEMENRKNNNTFSCTVRVTWQGLLFTLCIVFSLDLGNTYNVNKISHECYCTSVCVFSAFHLSSPKIITTNMRQNDFSHDQDRDCIHVFKFCYFSVNEYLQRIFLLQG